MSVCGIDTIVAPKQMILFEMFWFRWTDNLTESDLIYMFHTRVEGSIPQKFVRGC